MPRGLDLTYAALLTVFGTASDLDRLVQYVLPDSGQRFLWRALSPLSNGPEPSHNQLFEKFVPLSSEPTSQLSC